jgi:hypothetical protein
LIGSIPMRDGVVTADSAGVVDVVHRAWSKERVDELERALSRKVVRWRKQGDEIFGRPDGGLTFRFRLESGARQLRSLSLGESAEFRRLITALAEERYGQIQSRNSDSMVGCDEDRRGILNLSGIQVSVRRGRSVPAGAGPVVS